MIGTKDFRHLQTLEFSDLQVSKAIKMIGIKQDCTTLADLRELPKHPRFYSELRLFQRTLKNILAF